MAAYNFCYRRSRSQQTNRDSGLFNIENVSLITFGAPRVGNQAFKQHMDNVAGLKYNYRIIYGNDPITGVPPKKIGEIKKFFNGELFFFEHVGTEIRYNKNNFESPIKGEVNADTCNNDELSFWQIIKDLLNVNDHSQYQKINYKKLWKFITE